MRNCVTHFACDCITEKVLKLEKENAELKAQIRSELIEGQEPSERSQEAAHYNWLDDQNRQLQHTIFNLENELAEEKAKSQRLVEALEGFLDDCHNPVFDDHRLAYVHAQIYRYTVKKSRQALKEYKGEK